VFRALAALALASAASAQPNTATTALTSSAPWWERVTVTVNDDGQTRSCRYETSLDPNAGKDCSVVAAPGAQQASMSHGSGSKDEYTRITFERRFSPDSKPTLSALPTGDVLLSGQVMALAIDAKGAVKNCKVVETSGSVASQYSCSDAASEHFNASAAGLRGATREGYMSVLVYGHSEHVV
jgi:hypothetical protein